MLGSIRVQASQNGGRIILDTEWARKPLHPGAAMSVEAIDTAFIRTGSETPNHKGDREFAGSPSVSKTTTGVIIYSSIPEYCLSTTWPLAAGFSFALNAGGM